MVYHLLPLNHPVPLEASKIFFLLQFWKYFDVLRTVMPVVGGQFIAIAGFRIKVEERMHKWYAEWSWTFGDDFHRHFNFFSKHCCSTCFFLVSGYIHYRVSLLVESSMLLVWNKNTDWNLKNQIISWSYIYIYIMTLFKSLFYFYFYFLNLRVSHNKFRQIYLLKYLYYIMVFIGQSTTMEFDLIKCYLNIYNYNTITRYQKLLRHLIIVRNDNIKQASNLI